jgi:DNA-directed RNA polymerase specialized sigma subunit
VEWQKIKAEYISGGISLQRLSEKYGVSFSTIQKKSMEEKWSVLRKKGRRKAEEKLVEAVSEKNAKFDDRYFRLVDKLMQRAEETIENTPVWSVNGLKEMATAMKYLKECKGVKSEADIREQEARIAKLQKEAQEEQKDNEIQIIIGTEAEEYSI